MLKVNSIIDVVLGGVPDVYPLNILKPLDFMLEQDEHDAKFQEILDLKHSDISLVAFKQLVKDEVARLEYLKEVCNDVESLKPIGGKNLRPFKYSHEVWGLMTIYGAYDFAYKSYAEIATIYDYRIGNIVLTGVESIMMMKQKEATTGADAHDYKFYEVTETTRSRTIEFLVAGSKQDNAYFNKLYLNASIDDLLQNFFHVLSTQPLEAACLYVAETKAGNVMQYKNDAVNISFQTLTFRLLRTANSLGGFGVGMRKMEQLENLDMPNHNSKYANSIKINVGSSSGSIKQLIKPVKEDLEVDLIEQLKPLPRVHKEEELELKAYAKRVRRDDGCELGGVSDDKPKEAHIPSPYMQSRRNRAVSSKIVKNGLYLASDYSIVPPEILGDFLSSMPIETQKDKFFASLIIITLILGCKLEDTVLMLREDKNTLFTYADGVVTVVIDKSNFASLIAKDFLQHSGYEISFKLPHLSSMLVANAKRVLSSSSDLEAVDTNELVQQLKGYLTLSMKLFPKRVSINANKLYRHLKSYIKDTDADLITSFFATATYHQNDIPKIDYNATNKESQAHSHLVSSYWLKLDLDSVARDIIGLHGEGFSTKQIIVKDPKYCGSSRCVKVDKTRKFFAALDENIKSCIVSEDDALFPLVTIKIAYAMSLLVGTRSFNNSLDFSSWSYDLGTITISEKASSIAAGLRVIPLCDLINNGLKSYNEVFLQPCGLEQRVCFVDAGKVIPFTQHSALQTLKRFPKLIKRAILEEYVQNVPLNTGRHCFTKKATELSVSSEYISTYLGHNFSGSEQFGIYSTLDTKKYYEQVQYVTSSLAIEFGIGGLSW